jgi:hypothetical protein
MELFLPGIILILLSAFFAFMILPRIGSLVLSIVAILSIIIVGLHHYSMFYSEWRLSTWQYSLSAYAPFVVLGFAFLIISASVGYTFGGPEVKNAIKSPMSTIQQGVSDSIASMPSASTATNSITSAFNKAISSSVSSNGLGVPAPKANSNVKSPQIPGLGFSASAV